MGKASIQRRDAENAEEAQRKAKQGRRKEQDSPLPWGGARRERRTRRRPSCARTDRPGGLSHMKLAMIGYGDVGHALARLLRAKRKEFPFTIAGIHTLRHGTAVDAAGLPVEVTEAAGVGPRAASGEEFLDAARGQGAGEGARRGARGAAHAGGDGKQGPDAPRLGRATRGGGAGGGRLALRIERD